MTLSRDILPIKETISEAARYEQLAEECNELAHACLKKARKIRNENYTPKTMAEIDHDITEEYSDVILASEYALDIVADYDIMKQKLDRWSNRISKRLADENN